jgi:3-methyladenine DNA glycosylase AlkD
MKAIVPRKKGVSPEVSQAAESLLTSLRRRSNPERAKGVQQYFKHAVVSLGMDTPTLRACVREELKTLKPGWKLPEAVALCDLLLREPELEARGAGLLILSGFKREFSPALLSAATGWLETRLDNWALVDSFCSLVLSPILGGFPDVLAELRVWSRHRILWVRRAALVTLIPHARRGQLLDAAYEMAVEHFADPEDLMHKATGWLLREAGKKDSRRLRQYLLKHGPAIPRTALRYAIERFPAAERKDLLERTRPRPSPRPASTARGK